MGSVTSVPFPHEKVLEFNDLLVILNTNPGRIRAIVSSIKTNPILETVYIRDLDIDDERAENLILDAVFRNPNVKNVNITRKNICLQDLGSRLRSWRKLESLELWCLRITDQDPTSMFARLFRANRSLKRFKMSFVSGMGNAALEGIARALRYRSALESLEFFHCGMSAVGITSLSRALEQHSSLREVFVWDKATILSGVSAAMLAQSIVANEALESLELSVARAPTTSTVSLVMALISVLLRGLEFGREGSIAAARLIGQNYTLTSLGLVGTLKDLQAEENLDPYRGVGLDIEPVARALVTNSTLKKVKLESWFIFGASGLKTLCDSSEVNTTLESVSLFNNHISTGEVVWVCRLLSHFTALRVLDISELKLDHDATVALCHGIQQNNTMTELSVGACHFVTFFDSLGHNTSITKLSLSECDLADDDCLFLKRALEQNVTLQSLSLTDKLGNEGMRALLDGVRVHPLLTRVSHVQCSDADFKNELEFYLERNERFRPLLGQQLPLGLWPLILKRSDDWSFARGQHGNPDMLYFLVRAKCQELFGTTRRSGRNKRKRTR